MMKALVLGSSGFMGRNLVSYLQSLDDVTVLEHHHLEGSDLLREKCKEADCVFHLAGTSRPEDPSEYETANVGYLSTLLQLLEEAHNTCPVVLASSIQAAMEPPYGVTEYGRTKKEAEDLLLDYGKRTGARVQIYRLPHLFGPYGQPEYNNVMHTFIHHVANGLPVRIDNPDTSMQLLYATDMVKELVDSIEDHSLFGYCEILGPIYEMTLGKVVATLEKLRAGIDTEEGSFEEKLLRTMAFYRTENGSIG